MRHIFSALNRYRFAVVIALLLTLTELAVELVQPLIMARIIDQGVVQQDMETVLFWGGVMLILSFAAFGAGIVNSFYAAHASQNTAYDLRNGLFAKVQSFSFANFSQFPTSSLMTRITNDVNQIQNTIFMSLRIMLRAPLLVAGSVIMAIVVNAQLALILVLTIPLLVVFLVYLMRKAGALFKQVQSRVDRVNSVVQENLTAIRMIKAFTRRSYETERFDGAADELRVKMMRTFRLIETTMPVILLVMNFSIIVVLWFGTTGVNTGGATIGEVVAIINYITRMSGALTVFSMIIMIFSRARASAERIGEVFEADVDLKEPGDPYDDALLFNGEIVFDNVHFRYPGTRQSVLNRLSFTVQSREQTAVLGATGAGKTSLFQLIPRLYDTDGGTVRIDGKDVSRMPLKSLRRQIGYVPQETMLFSGTIEENLRWGNEEADENEMIRALKDAQIYDTIASLKHGLQSTVGQRGVNLSGGQKQRLAIARALLRRPSILLLDDSTSALDAKTEQSLLQAIRKYSCTTIMITQKMSTTVRADNILLLDEGELVGKGSHSQLLRESDLYREIYASQHAVSEEEGVHE
ncbi:ABC transporter ATP-binding protein [Salisediminibacterium halotolerans]|uniref:ABC transporter ATP-binding protein n=1 Tax=Salisediminibacterium halotolerans TaxID=517425 RepID=UPI000EB3450D|nr:ABC transporter ATP-binding protein [Salisediminibacterium halotolerans]RLJ71803.1 ATP-binding cassette subfamily B protein [Actinophytocola xinjiangensis]RPE86953.1 ATP-binding cassette subfamily B protein [Salisediminibacterium halotolerans]TWG33016.1 ATP-binding cassette subfamily B protein [Salisediminibacterium halotolerans]GEL08913.1 putative ABC transporter ATP-binding protein YfiB [Salisediminibacterium halotolerans]